MATDPKTRLKQLIDAHVKATLELSWAGGTGDSGDIPTAELNAFKAEDELVTYIASLTISE